jgi:precorrin-2/cobalt-factor-2 C20-methyltransferase
MSGTLFGIGVGPGDPELMTVKAWRLLATAKVVAFVAANGGESTARSIAAPFLAEGTTEIAIDMPMRVEREPGQNAYDEGAARISQYLAKGDDVVMLCEGDPFFYGSFMYVFQRLAPRFKAVVVPGVTSITAAAAMLGAPLCERDDVLKVLPATLPEADLYRELSTAQSAAIMKVGRHMGKVKQVLQTLQLEVHATAIQHATLPHETIRPVASISENSLPYFTTIIVRKPK